MIANFVVYLGLGIGMILFVVGIIMKNIPILILDSFLLIGIAVRILIDGIGTFNNNATVILGTVIFGIAVYIGIRSYFELITD